MPTLTRPDGTAPADLHVTRRAAVAMALAGYAVAALSAEAAPIVTPADGLTIEEASIPNGAPRLLPAYVARPAAPGRHPVVIVVNEIFGVHAYIKDVCRRFAALGYVAVAPDFFYRSGVDLPNMADRAEIMRVVAQADDAQVDGDVRAAIAWAQARPFAAPGRIGINGFCWGGAVVWRAAMADPQVRAGIAWYGRLGPLIAHAAEVRAPVLGLYGGRDEGIPATDIAAMRAALAEAGQSGSEIHVYPQAAHGFHADYRASYDPAAAADGWRRAVAFLRSHGVA